jgi:hypothetical protein
VSNIVIIEGQTFLSVESKKHGKFNVRIDSEDAERIGQHTWHVNPRPDSRVYFKTDIKQPNGKYTTLDLHRFIMSAPSGVQVDHSHSDYLDCRKSELRLATNQQNSQNSRKCLGTSSSFKGVSLNKQYKKWRAGIRHNGKDINLGYFPPTIDGELAAAIAYDIKATEFFGDYAKVNFPLLASLRARFTKAGAICWTGSEKLLGMAA